MTKFRIFVEVPGAEKPMQMFFPTESTCERVVKEILVKQPAGTRARIYSIVETCVHDETVPAPAPVMLKAGA